MEMIDKKKMNGENAINRPNAFKLLLKIENPSSIVEMQFII